MGGIGNGLKYTKPESITEGEFRQWVMHEARPALRDMSVAVDPYETDSYWVRMGTVQSPLQELGPSSSLWRLIRS